MGKSRPLRSAIELNRHGFSRHPNILHSLTGGYPVDPISMRFSKGWGDGGQLTSPGPALSLLSQALAQEFDEALRLGRQEARLGHGVDGGGRALPSGKDAP